MSYPPLNPWQKRVASATRTLPPPAEPRRGVAVATGGVAAAAGVGVGLLLWKNVFQKKRRAPSPHTEKKAEVVVEGLVWLGPVSREQAGAAVMPGVPTSFVTCTGDGHPSCAQIADGWKGADGRRIEGFAHATKMPPTRLALGAFSAGGHAVRRVLSDPRDRAAVTVVALADATYTTAWNSRKAREAVPIESYVAFGREVASDPRRLFVATASSAPNKEYPTGAETLRAIAAAIGLPEGLLPAAAGLPKPERAWMSAAGSVVLLDYGSSYTHEQHVTELAPLVWAALVLPRCRAGRKENV